MNVDPVWGARVWRPLLLVELTAADRYRGEELRNREESRISPSDAVFA